MPVKTPPSGIAHIWLLAKYELTKRFTNKSGMLALIAFMLIWGILLLYPIKSASEFIMQPNFKEFTEALFGPGSLQHLFEWPVPEFAVFWLAALYLFPMFSIFIAADQFSSDKQRGSLRFLTLRVSRSSLFFGRFIGQMLIQFALIILTLLATIVMVISRDISLLLPSLTTSLIVMVNLVIVLLPYTAVMAVLSLHANSARQASIFAVILWAIVSIIIAIINFQFPQLNGLSMILPGSQISSMINTQGLGSLAFAPIPLVQTVIILGLGNVLMKRSAL
ncbi:ABC transporter permease [Shewanella ulleungensis]|uniref:ABC transporter n=1 Tax=Shewanella ulleungensis TaxID=2282699 RepID=A0ABQ2QLE1_9GAMM|nr:ABC transporter permease subunit [Shewanella ulleungensis]MCL1151699.1 ABC transporter permease [Shewanella ulleungensis]GGP83876.1 ABC transporter [Shewanella ulleungensis]